MAALADPRAAEDPVVRRVQIALEDLVRDDLVGQRRADAEHARFTASTPLGFPRGARRCGASCGRPQRALDETTQHAARPAFGVVRGSLACSSSRISRQRTGLRRFSASSARMSSNGRVLPLERTGKAGSRIGVASSAALQRLRGGRHERRMKRARDGELLARPAADRAGAAHGGVDAAHRSRQDDLAGGVVVGERQARARRELVDVVAVAAEHGDHAAGLQAAASAIAWRGRGRAARRPRSRSRRRRSARRTRRASGRPRRTDRSRGPRARPTAPSSTETAQAAGCAFPRRGC